MNKIASGYMTRRTQSLGELIAAHMTVPGDVAEPHSESDFIISSLRAAVSANPLARRNILSEIAQMLGCSGKDLEFLFPDTNNPTHPTQKYEVMVPDFQTQLLALAE